MYLSCIRRASYGRGSRWNERQGSVISLPQGWARDPDKIPPWGSIVNLGPMKPALQFVRFAVVLTGGILAGGRGVEAVRAWREWRNWLAIDPSGADAYWKFFLMNTAAALISLCLAALVWHLLRPGQRSDTAL